MLKNRIKKVRTDSKLSMEKFGERIGITKSSVSLLESGKNNPSAQTLKLICKEFNINYDWLVTGEGNQEKDIDIDFGDMCADIGINDPKAREAIAKYYELSPEDKKLWWDFMERFMK